MAKPLILRRGEDVRVPFLRGILTRSLQEAGLPFQEAFRLASVIREELSDRNELPSEDLRKIVERHLEAAGGDAVRRYRMRRVAPPPVQVVYPDGHASPFSRGRQRLALAPCGISSEDAARVVTRILEQFSLRRVKEIEVGELGLLTYKILRSEVGAEAARRFVVWEEFQQSDIPLLVLLGGATGTGKSTITALLSNRLGIVRAQSTDMLREVMRTMIPERLLPLLHRSSFQAWEALPRRAGEAPPDASLLADGYRSQVELLSVACEAVFQRAITERVSVVIEGVHVHPSLLDRIPGDSGAIIVPVMLAVLDPKRLKQHIRGRGKDVPGRRAKRYLEHFDDIWALQSFLLSEADRAGVPIVSNLDMEEALEEVVTIVMRELTGHFKGKPSNVFP